MKHEAEQLSMKTRLADMRLKCEICGGNTSRVPLQLNGGTNKRQV